MGFFQEVYKNSETVKNRKLTGFSGRGEVVVAAVKGTSFPLEREEAVET
jgi:hypothetical protein